MKGRPETMQDGRGAWGTMGGGDGDGASDKACALGGQFGSLSRKIKQVDTYAAVREQTTVPRCIQIVASLRPRPLYCTCCLYIRPAHAPPYPAASSTPPAVVLAAIDNGDARRTVSGAWGGKGGKATVD